MSVEPGLTVLAVTPVPRARAPAPHEAGHTGLRRAVGRQHRQPPGGGGRRDGQEPSVARGRPPEQRRDRHPGQGQQAAEVDVRDGPLLLGRQLPRGHAAGDDPGHRDGGVEAAPAVLGRARPPRQLGRIAGVGHRRDDVRTGRRTTSRVRPGTHRVRDGRVVGAPVDRNTHQPSAASAATVAAPIPRAAPVTSATRPAGLAAASALTGSALGVRRGHLRRPLRPPRRDLPDELGRDSVEQRRALGCRRPGRVAEHPVRADRGDAVARQSGQQLGHRTRLAGLGPIRRTAAPSSASWSDVSVRPAWASPPQSGIHSSTRRDSAARRCSARRPPRRSRRAC